MSALRRSRTVLLFTVLLTAFAIGAVAVLVLAPAASVEALPAFGRYCKYYSDASHSCQVGLRYSDCDGVFQSSWGTTSPYSTVETVGCIEN